MDLSWDAKCQIEHYTVESRVRHMWNSSRHIICDVCVGRSRDLTTIPHEFLNLEERLQHYFTAHLACKVCSTPKRIERFATQEELRDHMYQHCACPCCDILITFNGLTELRLHLQNYHKACGICSSKDVIVAFENATELLSHREEFHHACIFQCGVPIFADDKSLGQHYIAEHFGCFGCPIRGFTSERERNAHYDNEHHGLRDHTSYPHASSRASYHCRQCGPSTRFNHRSELVSHKRTYHGAVNCPEPSCRRPPQIPWLATERAHMESCHYPNPCNDFDTQTAMGLKTCYICNASFITPGMVFLHYRNCHRCDRCEGYRERYFKIKHEHNYQCHGEGRSKPRPFERPRWKNATPRAEQMRPPPPPGPVDIYAVLRIHAECSDEEAMRAARQRRIETHPDKLKREGMSMAETEAIDEMAQLVGFAADVVADPAKRWEHDEEVRRWRVKYGQ